MRRGQGRFQVVEYTGEDAAEVLIKIINGVVEPDEHEVESETAVRTVGFQRNKETDDPDAE